MSAGDQAPRPSVPHALTRVRTDRAPSVPPIDEAETVRENVDPALAEMLALLKDPSGMSIETVLKLLLTGQRHATASTRQADKLGVDLGVGRLQEQIGSMVASRTFVQQVKSRILGVATIVSTITALALALWTWLVPKAHEEAAAVIVAPAVAAEAKVLTMEERMDAAEKRHDETEATLSNLAASVERLNGAVVSLTDRLSDPPPHEIVVPTPRRGKKAGLDE